MACIDPLLGGFKDLARASEQLHLGSGVVPAGSGRRPETDCRRRRAGGGIGAGGVVGSLMQQQFNIVPL